MTANVPLKSTTIKCSECGIKEKFFYHHIKPTTGLCTDCLDKLKKPKEEEKK